MAVQMSTPHCIDSRQSWLRRFTRISFICCLAFSLMVTCSVAVSQNSENDSSEEVSVHRIRSPGDIAAQLIPAGKARAADGSSFTRRPRDEERPEEQFTLEFLNRPLTIGGEVETEFRYREDLSLGRQDDDDLRFTQGLQLDFLYGLSSSSMFYAKIQSAYRADLYSEDGDTESTRILQLGEGWLAVGGFGHDRVGLQIGRQNFEDEREWWVDEQLDAVRVHYIDGALTGHVSIGINPTTFLIEQDRVRVENEDTIWLLSGANWEWTRKNYLEAFFLSRFDYSMTPEEGDIAPSEMDDEDDGTVSWLGLRSRGRIKMHDLGKISYWLDTGVVYGKETVIDFDDIGNDQNVVDEVLERTVSGWGLDVGATWETKLPFQPRLTLGYAKGSGDANPDDGVDNAYRQSGLQSNDNKFGNVNSFRYYGELLRPELSNINISTIALGFPLFQASSVELVYHRYTQNYAVDDLRASRLRTDPEGENRDIGEEFDIILGFEDWKQIEIELIFAQFRAGNAFGSFSGQTSTLITLQAEYNF